MHLFAGAGGGILADLLLGDQPVCAVEINEYCQQVLSARQADGTFPWFPIFADVTKFDGKPWRGVIDVVSGGFPCQDISSARTNNGGKGEGINGSKSGLWSEFARVIGEVEPKWVLVENSHHLRTKGLGRVLKDLACLGYDATWGVLSAKDCGANHERKRMWIVAHTNDNGKSVGSVYDEARRMQKPSELLETTPNTNCPQRERRRVSSGGYKEYPHPRVGSWWKDTSHLDGMDDGMAYRMDRLKATGNGQVPIVAATAFNQLANVLAKHSSLRSAS